MRKALKELIQVLGDNEIFGSKEILIRGIVDDSRKVKKGSLFVAIRGATLDAHKFIPRAIASGATAVVGEKKPLKNWLDKTTYIKVPNSRRALALLASAWYDYPSKSLKIIGVTGTDGKTTTSNLIHWILVKSGKRAGVVSTIAAKIGTREYSTGLHVTNPEPLVLQKFLAKMVQEKCQYAVLEVTSHGLDQERVAGIDFDIGVLTNITHEHIDYHQTFKRYLLAKSKLFEASKAAILNNEDRSYKVLRKILYPKRKVIAYNGNSIKGSIRKTVAGRFLEPYNQLNATAAILVARELGLKDKVIEKGIKSFPAISGRMEEIKNKSGIRIIVDFAHTPNALENLLKYLKGNKKKNRRLITVFGCGGERDVAKRPLMGRISAELSDISVFTAEDPRDEDVNEIINQMMEGASMVPKNKRSEIYIKPERGGAITFAIQKLAKKGETVVICGKGHEKSMAYKGVEYPWSDQEAVKIASKGGVKQIKRK